MDSKLRSREDILADARAALREDDRDRAERSGEKRRNGLLSLAFIHAALFVALAFFFGSLSSAHKTRSATPAAEGGAH